MLVRPITSGNFGKGGGEEVSGGGEGKKTKRGEHGGCCSGDSVKGETGGEGSGEGGCEDGDVEGGEGRGGGWGAKPGG